METPENTSAFSTPAGIQAPPGQASDPAQESLVSALRSSFAILRLIMYVLVILYISSGIFQIEPGDQGVVVRFGRLVDNPETGSQVFTQGWKWAWPDPIDEKIRLSGSVHRLETDAFLFKRRAEEIADETDISTIRWRTKLQPGVDGAMLTGDKNLSHGLWAVEYRIENAAQFVRTIGENPQKLEPLLRRMFESRILREVSYRKVEEVTRTKRDIIADDVRRRLQQDLNQFEIGVQIVKVTADTVVPPRVAPAFDNVTKAENERKQQEDAAHQLATETLNQVAGPQYRDLLERIRRYGDAQLASEAPDKLEQLRAEIDDALPNAQGEVAARLRDARARADGTREEINREYQEFTYWLEQYRTYPRQTKIKLWSRMWNAVLSSNENEIFWVPNSDVIEILVNRDPQRAIEAERERLLQQVPPGPH